jgi:cholinesterase
MKAFILSYALFGAALSQELQNRASNWTVGQTVQTSSGPVNGHEASNDTGVSEYLGIPYAISPVGDLRWTAPQKYAGNSTVNGTHFVRFLSRLQTIY